MKTTKEKGLIISTEADRHFGHVVARIVSVEEPTICNWSDDWADKWTLEDIRISCQMSRDDRDHTYAWNTEYRQPFSIDHARVIKMAKTLRAIENKLKKFEQTRGMPGTFSEYVMRVAEIIVIRKVVREDHNGSSHWYKDNRYSFLPAAFARGMVEEAEIEVAGKLLRSAA